jgi:hypothetical protein
MPHVTHTAEGWQAGADGSVYDTLREALDAALPGVAVHAKSPYFRGEDGEEIGVYRWLPACAEEDVPLRGVRIDSAAIEEMALSLNDATRAIPIDGGSDDSPAHGTILDPGTKANGRGHWAVVALNADGRLEIYLWAELLPAIAAEVDLGRLGEGSVHVRFGRVDGDAMRDVEWASHALLNDPGVVTLAPANSVRDGRGSSAWRSVAIAGRSMPSTKSITRAAGKGTRMKIKTTIRAKLTETVATTTKNVALRGPALDKLAEIAALLGVNIDKEMDGDSWDSPISDAIQALKSLASAEKVLEVLPSKADGEVAASRAADDEEKPKASAAVAKALGLEDTASEEDILAAIAKLLEKDKPADEGAGEVAAARAATAALRTEVVALRAEVAELQPLREEKAVRDREAAIDAAMAARGMKSAEQRKAFLSVAEKFGNDAALASIEAAHVPPTGTIAKPLSHTQRSSAAPESTEQVRDATEEELEQARALVPELRKQFPNEPNHMLLARAQKRILNKR